jgi:uncharacterized protein
MFYSGSDRDRDLIYLPNSSLILFRIKNGYRLFCLSSLMLMDLEVQSWDQARAVAELVNKNWPSSPRKLEFKDDTIWLTISLTQNCNLSCQYCYLHGDNAEWMYSPSEADMDFSFEAILREIQYIIGSKPQKMGINFIGGEPLLRKEQVIDIVEHTLKSANEQSMPIEIGLTTNGTLLNRSFLEWAQKHKIDIMVSLDSPAIMHDNYRARRSDKNSFYNIISSLQGFESVISVVTTITHQTPSLREALENLIELGFKEVLFNIVHTRNPELMIRSKDVQRFLDEFENDQDWFDRHSLRLGNINRIHDLLSKRQVKLTPCAAGRSLYAINSKGVRYFCHSCVGKEKFTINRNDKSNISEFSDGTYSLVPSSRCATCWAVRLCGGDCWLIQWYYNDKERDLRCSLIRGLSKLALSTFPASCN